MDELEILKEREKSLNNLMIIKTDFKNKDIFLFLQEECFLGLV